MNINEYNQRMGEVYIKFIKEFNLLKKEVKLYPHRRVNLNIFRLKKLLDKLDQINDERVLSTISRNFKCNKSKI